MRPNLLLDAAVAAVVIEWTTDYVVVGSHGRIELVSVKHREQDQRAWTFGDLGREHVFRDLYGVWKELREDGDYVFESSRGIGPRLRAAIADAADDASEASAMLAAVLEVDRAEAARFASRLIFPPPTPDRSHIREVASSRMVEVMLQLGLDPALAPECVMAMEARVADIAVDRPLEPAERIRALAGLMRDIRDQRGQGVANFFLSMDELRDVVTRTASGRFVPARPRPPADDPLFTGRDAELTDLADMLTPGQDGLVTPVVLTGMPGIGKSAIAVRFAAVSGKRARVIPADTRAALLAGIHQLNPTEPSAASVRSTATQPTRATEPTIPEDPGLLLIIDGLTDPAVAAGLVPRVSRASILITATSPHVDDGFRHLHVGGLSAVDATAYLRKVMPDAAEQDVAELISAFDGNALGLVQGANYCLSTGITLLQYLERLRLDPTRLLNLGYATGHPVTIAAAISAGLTQACTEPATSALTAALAWLAPDPVPEWLFGKPPILVQPSHEDPGYDQELQTAARNLASLTDPLVLDAAVTSLARHGLVSRAADGLRMHQLVQDVTRARTDYPVRRAQYQATVGLLLAAMIRDDIRPSPNALSPHVAAAVEATQQVSADPLITSRLMTWLGEQYYDFGDLEPATSYLLQAAAVARRPDLPRETLVGILRVLVKVQRAAGDVDAAIASADEWADAARSARLDLDEYHARFARAATLAHAQRFEQAGRELGELTGRSRPAGLTLSDKIIELSVLAEIRRGTGSPQAALDAITEATQLARDHTSGLTRADHVAALSAQASQLARDLGKPAEALASQRAAVAAARELGLRGPLARALHGLASRLIDSDLTNEAAEVLDEANEILGADSATSSLRADFMQVAGRLALPNNDLASARRLLSEAIVGLEASGEPHRPDLAAAWDNLGTTQMTLRDPRSASESYLKARQVETSLYGEGHPDLIATEYSLAAASYSLGDINAATEAINRCLRLIRRGGPQARLWRDQALSLAIAIDVAASPGLPPS